MFTRLLGAALVAASVFSGHVAQASPEKTEAVTITTPVGFRFTGPQVLVRVTNLMTQRPGACDAVVVFYTYTNTGGKTAVAKSQVALRDGDGIDIEVFGMITPASIHLACVSSDDLKAYFRSNPNIQVEK